MIILYQRTDCPFCWKVRLALAELGIEYESVDLQLGEKHPDLLAHSPTGTVPMLFDNGTIIWESAVILDYLDKRYGSGRLIPGEPAEEARIRLLHSYSDKIVGGCIRDLVFEKRSKPESQWDAELIQTAAGKWRGCMDYLDDQLGGREYFGGTFSVADCALAARFGVAEAYGEAVTPEFPALHRWYERVTARDSWSVAFPTSFIRTPEEAGTNGHERKHCAVR